ncbi:phage holin family protein [Patescibacteria group bacterium]|nr:phage holin family protein [Patescibacteria group bacterium]
MKRILRHYIIDTFSLWAVSQIAEGLIFGEGIKTLLIAGAGVMCVSLLAKPVINLLLLPLNLITFGLFRWVSSAIVIYLVTLIVPKFEVAGFHFVGFTSPWLDFPALTFKGFWTYIGFSFLFSLIAQFIYWLIKK